MGKKRSKTTSKQRKAKSAEQQRGNRKSKAKHPSPLIAGSLLAKSAKRNNENIFSPSISSSNPQISNPTTTTRSHNGNNNTMITDGSNTQFKIKTKKQRKKLMQSAMMKWNAPQDNILNSAEAKRQKKKEEEQREFDNHMTSLREREYNRKIKEGSSIKHDGSPSLFQQMAPATLKCFPTTLTEHVDHTANLVEQKLDMITQQQGQGSSTTFTLPSIVDAAQNTVSTTAQTCKNPLQELADRKRKELHYQHNYIIQEHTDEAEDPLKNNPYGIFASYDDDEDDGDTNKIKKPSSSSVKPLQFAPPSFNFGSSFSTSSGPTQTLVNESNAFFNGPATTTSQNNDCIDPDL